MRSGAALVVGLLLTVASRAVFATQHTVGDTAGWNKATDYVAWAATKPFAVGDTLVFNYGREDLVYEVLEDDYKNCKIGTPMHIYNGHGQTIIPLDKPGQRYFLSPTFGHCANGMKLAINIKPGTTSGTIKDLLTLPTIMPTQLPPNHPGGTCPGGGGGGQSPPFNPPFIPDGGGGQSPPFNPPFIPDGGGGQSPPINPPFNPFMFGPPNPYGPYRPHGGATSLDKISVFTIGFYSLLVLIISFMA